MIETANSQTASAPEGFVAHLKAALDDRRRAWEGGRSITKGIWAFGVHMTLVEFGMGIALALGLSWKLGNLLATAALWALSIPREVSGEPTAVSRYVALTLSLMILAYGKRWLIVPAFKLMNFPPKGEGHLLWARTLVRGVLAIGFRRRVYEIGIVLLVASILAELGIPTLANLAKELPFKAVLGSLVTFLAIDTYALTFYPKQVQADDQLDPKRVESEVRTKQ
jgi:hypothetical protein